MEPGQEERAGREDGRPVEVAFSTPADGHDTITNTVRGATVRDE
jgi:hypothetical protein